MQQTISPKDQDEITLKELVSKIRRLLAYLRLRWQMIALITIIGIIAGVTYSNYKKAIYTADCNFVIESGDKNNVSNPYSGMASLMGLDAGNNSGLFQGDNILELYKSRLMVERTLLSPAKFKGKTDLLINRYIDINHLRKNWEKDPKLKNITFAKDKSNFTVMHDSVMTQVINDINGSYLTVEHPNQKVNIIKVSVKSADQYFAKEFADKIVQNVNTFYVQTKTQRSLDNINILTKQVDSLRYMLSSSMRQVAAVSDANPNANPAMQSLRMAPQRKQVDVQATQSLYLEELNNLELAKISLRKERPIIQVIDGPVYPLPSTRVGKFKGAIVGGLLGFFAITFILIIRKAVSNLLA